MAYHDGIAPESEISETKEKSAGQTWLEREIAARHALFDNPETATRDEDDLPVDRGASGANLRWCEVLGDGKLDRQLRRAAWRLQKKHPNSDLDAEEVAQRIRLRLTHGYDLYKAKNGLGENDRPRFNLDRGWTKYAQTVIQNTCASFADRMEREAKANRLLISRDTRDEKDADGDNISWRENLDFRAACDELDRDELKLAVEAAIAEMSGLSKKLIESYYRDGLGQRTLAQNLGMALSSFQNGPWKQMKADFRKNFTFFLIR